MVSQTMRLKGIHRRTEEPPVCSWCWPLPPVCSLLVSDSNSGHSLDWTGWRWQRRQSLADAGTPEFTGITPNHHQDLGNNMIWLTQYPHHQRPPLSRLLGWGYDFLTPLKHRLAGNTTHDSQSAKKQQQGGIVESNPSSLGGEERVEKCRKIKKSKVENWLAIMSVISRLGGRPPS